MDQAARAHSSLPCRHLSLLPPGSKNRCSFLSPTRRTLETRQTDSSMQFGSTMSFSESDSHQVAPGGPPTRRDLASDTKPPSFSIEKHFVLPPTRCAFHLNHLSPSLILLSLSPIFPCRATFSQPHHEALHGPNPRAPARRGTLCEDHVMGLDISELPFRLLEMVRAKLRTFIF